MKRVLIGDQVDGFVLAPGSKILYRTGQKHKCDPKCLAADHRYEHKVETRVLFQFTKKFPMVGTADKQVAIPGVGKTGDV